jgi:glucan 1,3-beta-glucosidase
MIEALNEPAPWALRLPLSEITPYFVAAHDQVRAVSPGGTDSTISFWLHDTFTSLIAWDKTFAAPRFTNVVMDSHHYEVFDPVTIADSPECHSKYVCQTGIRAAQFVFNNFPVVFGEWSGALTDCTIHCIFA